MPGAEDLINPSTGRPLIQEPRLIVLKRPPNMSLGNIPKELSKATGCAVMELPMSAELIMGRVAMEELQSIHSAIHAITASYIDEFNNQEISMLTRAMEFLCKQTSPSESSDEVALTKKLKIMSEHPKASQT